MNAIERAKTWIGEGNAELAEGMNTIIIIRDLLAEITRLQSEQTRLNQLLYGGRCVYCGEVVGQDKQNQDLGDEVLRQHVAVCKKHPLNQVKKDNKLLHDKVTALESELAEARLIKTDTLTEREKWLMRRAWVEGWDVGNLHDPIKGMDDWLSGMAADGVTVEMVLAKEAPSVSGKTFVDVEKAAAMECLAFIQDQIHPEHGDCEGCDTTKHLAGQVKKKFNL